MQGIFYMQFDNTFCEQLLFDKKVGDFCHDLAKTLFPICRSLTGPGVRETLAELKKYMPDLTIHEVPSGTEVFDWTVPDEWTIRDAYIADESGQRIIDFNVNNLHVVGYSESVDQWFSLEDLDEYLYSIPEQEDAIPYITSYYSRRWGFCLTHKQRRDLKPGRYRAVIDADLKPGVLNYGELILPGKLDKEVLLSTYVCHPSMGNNELSGPVVTTALVQWLQSLGDSRRYTYRVIFVPETIGSIVYLSRHLEQMKQATIAGFNISCVGDNRAYSYLPSRHGSTVADQAAKHVLKYIDPDYKPYTWLERGSDERQYCAPGVDLPIASIMRTKYGEYPEYHTSLDDLTLITPEGLAGGFNALRQAIEVIEKNMYLKSTVLCEPQLGKRGLYPTLSAKQNGAQVRIILNLTSYCDGRSLLDIAEIINEPFLKVLRILEPLLENGLIQAVEI